MAAIIGGAFVFRKQIGDFVKQGAAGLGGAAGEAIGGGIGALPLGVLKGFGGQFSQFVPTGKTAKGETTASPFGLPGPFDFLFGGNVQRAYGDSGTGNFGSAIGGSQPTNTDRVVNQYNRDYSDNIVATVKLATLGSTLQTQALGHKQAAEAAIASNAGYNPSAQFKAYLAAERARGSTQSVSEIYGYWRR